ncbi:MAG: energy transducer TonB [Pedobacter sp.]|nr:MAG: energy transducer TonB [Pedobacter sp.]
MTFNQLTAGFKGIATALLFSSLVASCNDDKSGNNSSTGSNDANTDTSSAMSSNAPATGDNTAAAKKKTGKASATMNADDANAKMEMDKQGYYNRAEVAPAYSGGQTALEDYINSNIEYPQNAIDNSVEGVVNVQFAVDEKGNVSNVSTVGPKVGYGLEEEAIRVVSKMPKWTPGTVKKKNVKVWRTLPINYRLES